MATTAGVNIKVYAGSAQAINSLTFSGGVSDGETVTIGSDIYEFDTGGAVTAGNILVDVSGGATAPDAVTALVAAINANDASLCAAVDGPSDTVAVTAKEYGTKGNAISCSETCADGEWSNATFINGADAVVALQRSATMRLNGETIDITHKTSTGGWREYLPSWKDGEVTCAGLYDVNGTGHELLYSIYDGKLPVSLKFALNATASRYFYATAYITSLEPSAEHEDAALLNATFRLTGEVTYVDA